MVKVVTANQAALISTSSSPRSRRSSAFGSGVRQDFFQASVRGVSARDPDYLRRLSQPIQQKHEVTVFGHYHSFFQSGSFKYFFVFRIPQAEITNCDRTHRVITLIHAAIAGEI